jgi:DNA invertase Pin-like site-specific DNA recombinase
MKVFYSRVSTVEQNESRQIQNLEGFDEILIDKESGLTPLFLRKNGSRIKKWLDDGVLTHLEVHSIDRLGRDTLSVLSVWKEFTEKGVRVVCRNPNFQNLNEKGEVDFFSELLLNILSTMSGFEKSMIKSRQMEGIKLAKMTGVYQRRKKRGREGTMRFLQKHSKAVEYLEMGMKGVEVSKLCDISLKTVTKVKKLVKLQSELV